MQRCLLTMVWLRVNSIATLAAMGCLENLRDQRFRVRGTVAVSEKQARYDNCKSEWAISYMR